MKPLDLPDTELVTGGAYAGLLAALQNQCFEHSGERLWTEKDASQLLNVAGCQLFLQRTKEEISGFALYLVVAPEAELVSFGILPAFRRQRLGLQLLVAAHARLEADNVSRVTLEVRANNYRAITLYECAGFQKIGVRRKYYRMKNGERLDGILYDLVLSQ